MPAEILFDISHNNLLMYGAATPSYDYESRKSDKQDLEWGGVLDGDNPDNFINTKNDRQRI